MEKIKVKIRLLHPDAKVPYYGSEEAAGFDLFAIEDKVIAPGAREIIGTGISLEVEPGISWQYRDRSGIGSKGVTHFAGLLDSDYRGEFKVILFNSSAEPYEVKKGDRIIQVVPVPIPRVEFEQVEELKETARGENGFGSTDLQESIPIKETFGTTLGEYVPEKKEIQLADDFYVEKLKDMNWPQEFGEKLIVGNPKSNVAIATLWTFKEVVAEKLSKEDYAVIGHFYDKSNGIEPLIRNCLANPNIRYIIVVGNDKADSKKTLVNFFQEGFENGKIIGTDIQIPKIIPIDDLEKLRKNVKVIDVASKITDLNNPDEYKSVIEEEIKFLEKKEPFDIPRLYEKPVLSTDSFPSEKVGFLIRGKTVGETWLKLLHEIYSYGAITKMKTKDSTKVRECINLVSVVEEEDADNPKMEEYFRFDENYLKEYYDEICTDKIPEGTLYTYGSRFRAWDAKTGEKIDQIADMIEYLKQDTYRKSAIAITWIVEDELTRRYLNKDKNSPCIDLVQPNVQDGVLHFTVYIRSNDMFRAWPINAFGLRKLQKIIAQGLGVGVGTLTTISCSAHIYQDNWEDTKELLEKHYEKTHCFWDIRGYYIIELKGGEISVQHLSTDGVLLKEYAGKTAREINDQINSSHHTIDSYHASYLGEELMKAEIALKNGWEYSQDAPLDSGNKTGVCE